MAKREPRISWQIEEYSHREKGPDWFWALGVVVLAGAAAAVIFHDVLFAIFIVLAGAILGYYAAREPGIIEIAIGEDGITIKDFFYPYEKLKGFAIDEHVLGNNLLIESDRMIAPVTSIPLPVTLDTEALADLLRTRLPEKKLKVEIAHRLMEHMGF